MMKDCIIIGKGPAGLSAALYVRRAGFTPVVIGRDSGALGQSHRIENYFGLEAPISGDELFRRGLAQVERLGIEVISDEVVSIRETEDFRVNTASGRILSGHSVLLATGRQRNVPRIPGIEQFIGAGVSQCAQCDGFLMRNRALAVIGSGDHAVAELSHLRPLTNNLCLFTNGATITTDRFPKDLPIVTEPIVEFYGENGMLAGIRTTGGDQPIDGAFLAQGIASASDFAARMGVIMHGGSIQVDRNYQTNVPGLFAAGDCIGGVLQIAKAVSDGAIAGLSICEYIKNLPKQPEE